ncbi:MAG: metallophosphoesterase [Lachnospiraceae bacterium]|jgi:putative phosphoesterase|nr:metallophosphoesterase [Lachnospiraceae bacterium]
MKILIVSDTHRRDENLKAVIDKLSPIDALIHLGDSEGSENLIAGWVNPGCRVEIVSGNNDFFSSLEKEKVIMLGPYRTFLTHGHYYGVNFGTERMFEETEDRECQIGMFGHTHRPSLEQKGGITVLNPGSISYPRQEGRCPSYILMEIDAKGEAHYTINYLPGALKRQWE